MKVGSFKLILFKLVKSKIMKLITLGVSTIALLLTSGYSYAKYHDEYKNNANAGIAKYGVEVNFHYTTIEMPSSINNSDYGYYVQIAEFWLDFTKTEVSLEYNINLVLSGEYGTDYNNPTTVNYSYFRLSNMNQQLKTFKYNSSGVLDSATTTLNEMTGANNLTFTSNVTYYATAITTNDTINYTWTSLTNSNATKFTFPTKKANVGEKHYYKLVYFVYINSSGAENSVILGKINASQVQ